MPHLAPLPWLTAMASMWLAQIIMLPKLTLNLKPSLPNPSLDSCPNLPWTW